MGGGVGNEALCLLLALRFCVDIQAPGGEVVQQLGQIALVIIMALTLAAMGVSFADRAREKSAPGAL